MRGTQEPASSEAVRDALDRVLAQPGFHAEETWVTRFIEAVQRFFEAVGLDGVAVDERVLLVLVVILGLVLGWIIARLLARVVDTKRGPGPGAEVEQERRIRASEFLAAADVARSSGDLRLALRLYWTALVVGLGERGSLEYRGAWTNRELLARGALDPEVARELEVLLSSIEAKEFGRARVEPTDLERLREECRARGLTPSAGSVG